MKKPLTIGLIALILLATSVHAIRIIPNSMGIVMNQNNVKIYWVTDEKSDTTLLYGIENMDKTIKGARSVIDHVIYLSNLEENKEYSYQVTSCTSAGECVSSDVKKFKYIKPDTTPPVLSFEKVPEKAYDPNIDINGKVNENVTIAVYVDNNKTLEVNVNGSFTLGVALHDGKNKIEIIAKDRGNNTVKKTFIIEGDVTPIELISTNLDEIDKTISGKQVVKGSVNKPFVDIIVKVGNETYKTKADENGKFSVEISLDVSTDKAVNDIVIYALRGDNKLVNLYKSSVTYFQCSTGSSGMYWKVNISDLTPDVIIPEHLINGIAQFGFRLDFEYIGNGKNPAIISNPFVVPAPLNELQKKKMQEELVGSPVVQCTSDKRHCYVLVNLLPWQGSKQELYDKTKWFSAFGTNIMELTIPLELKIPFTQEVNGKQEQKDQNMCWFFKVMIDSPVPFKANAVLKNSIGALNNTISAIKTIREPLEDYITPGVFAVCLGTVMWEFPNSLGYQANCNPVVNGADDVALAKQLAANSEKECPPSAGAGCQKCLDAIWNYRNAISARQWVCDRIFCPAVPTIEKHAETYKDPLTGSSSACINAAGNSQQTAVSSQTQTSQNQISYSDACKSEYKRQWDSAGLFMDEYAKATGTDDSFTGAMNKVVETTNGFCPGAARFPEQVVNSAGKEYYISKDKEVFLVSCYKPARSENGKDIIQISPNLVCKKQKGPLSKAEIPDTIKEKLEYEDKTNKDFVFDPTSGPVEAVEAGCLPGIDGYLIQWQNILGAVKKCFENVLVTGEASSGMCKAVLSRYVCDAIWDSVRCLGGGMATMSKERIEQNNKLGKEPSFLQNLGATFGSLTSSINDRYGETTMFDVMFKQKKLIHSACMNFFGIDLPGGLDLKGMLSSAYTLPSLNSEALIAPATRRFITSNPLNHGWATHIYHLGYAIQAGADIKYTLKLVCSNDVSCDGGACDCYNLGHPIEKVVESGQVKKTDMLNKEKFLKIEDKVRYDKAVLEWTWTDNNGNIKKDSIEVPIKLVGMNPPDYCSFDSAVNEYRCKIINDGGKVYFAGRPSALYPQGRTWFSLGEQLKINGNLISEMDANNPNPKFLNVSVINSKGVLVYSTQKIVNTPGTISLETLNLPVVTQEMFRKQDGSDACPDTAQWKIIIEILKSEKDANGQYYQTNEIEEVDGNLQQQVIPVTVKCTSASGGKPSEVLMARFKATDKDGLTTYFDLSDNNIEAYYDGNKIVFELKIKSDSDVSIGLSVDGSKPEYHQSQPPENAVYEWYPKQSVNKQDFKLQFYIRDGHGVVVKYPEQPKEITLITANPTSDNGGNSEGNNLPVT